MQTRQFALLVGSMVLLSAIATANSPGLSARDAFQKMGVLVTELPAEFPPESLVQQIAQTEVELVLMSQRVIATAPQMVQLQLKLAQLNQQLEKQVGCPAPSLVRPATRQALQKQLRELEAQNSQDRQRYIAAHPVLQLQIEQMAALRQRLRSVPATPARDRRQCKLPPFGKNAPA